VELLRWMVLVLAVLPFAYYSLVIVSAIHFFRRRENESVAPLPAVSILKPVHGLDYEAYENFASFCHQNYPKYEILFGVADEQDSSIPVIRKLIQDFPDLPIRLLIGYKRLGSNDKVNKLCRLVREARYDVLVISDSDIRVEPAYLQKMAAALEDKRVGIVTCMYRGVAEPHFWSALEAFNLSSSFMPGVLAAWLLERVRFGMGATIGITRQRLRQIGEFETLADFAADDYELGRRVAARGYRVELSRCVVQTICSSHSGEELFKRQLRWATVVRNARPGGHFGWLLAQGLPWSLAAAAASRAFNVAAVYVGAYLALRLAVAWEIGRAHV